MFNVAITELLHQIYRATLFDAQLKQRKIPVNKKRSTNAVYLTIALVPLAVLLLCKNKDIKGHLHKYIDDCYCL